MKTPFKIAAVSAVALSSLAGPIAHGQDAPFISQIKAFAFDYCPYGWHQANGQVVQIADNQALFSLIGTRFGGDGRATMAMPDLTGRFATSQGTGPGIPPVAWGQRYGQPTVTLTVSNLPVHSHRFRASEDAPESDTPTGLALGTFVDAKAYAPAGLSNVALHANSIAPAGGSAPISIQDPWITMTMCINHNGVYPSRN